MTFLSDASPPAVQEPGVTDVVSFWLGDALTHGWPSDKAISKRWWISSKALDAQIAARFGSRVRDALAGGLACWEVKPLARLALVIVLDQFTRNVFRGTAHAFDGDARAQTLALDALDRGLDTDLPLAGRLFLAMPLMHAEDRLLQERGVRYFTRLAEAAPPNVRATVLQSVDSAREHRDIVARFGRFPYRNKVLGRTDTPEEEDFLRHGPRFGQ